MSAIPLAIPVTPAIQIKKILFATDFSEASLRAVPLAAAIARTYQSEIYVANVWSPLPYSMGAPDAPVKLEMEQFNDAVARTRKFAKTPALADVPTEVIVEQGDVGEEIAHIVRERNIDLVVLSTHGRTGWKRALIGSVAEHLLRELTCLVLTVGPRCSTRLSKEFVPKALLFPTDFSEESRIVFPYFASLAADHNCELIVTHVLPQETGVNPGAKLLAEPLRQQIQSVYGPHIRTGCKAEFIIEFGDPTARILSLAKNRTVDLIGMGVRKAPEFVTHFRKTVTYGIVLEASCPVLTWRAQRINGR